MNAQDYIAKHPKTILTKQLIAHNIDGEIKIISGLVSDAPNSKLHKAMQTPNAKGYAVGGRAGKNANDGYFIAVYF